MATRYRAQMAPHADQSSFGWMIAIAIVLAAVPFVIAFQQRSPEPIVWIGCLVGAAALVALAMRKRSGSLHEIVLSDDDGVMHFVVSGPSVNVDVRGAITARAVLGEIVAGRGGTQMRMPVRVLTVMHDGRPVVVLEEAVGGGAGSADWPDAGDDDLGERNVPSLMKSLVPPDLEKLRAALVTR